MRETADAHCTHAQIVSTNNPHPNRGDTTHTKPTQIMETKNPKPCIHRIPIFNSWVQTNTQKLLHITQSTTQIERTHTSIQIMDKYQPTHSNRHTVWTHLPTIERPRPKAGGRLGGRVYRVERHEHKAHAGLLLLVQRAWPRDVHGLDASELLALLLRSRIKSPCIIINRYHN